MTQAVPIPDHNYSILTPEQLALLKERAQPRKSKGIDQELEMSRTRHEKTVTLVSGWQNTVARNRLDRQTRLQKEKEAEEQRKILIDEEEKKFQKLKKQATLAEAKKKGFLQRSEVRAVNAQLLLHEVQLERQAQETFAERRKIMEMQRQIEEDEMARAKYEQMIANEEKIRRERKQRAIEVAEGFKKQREEKMERTMREKQEQFEDDLFLRKEYITEEEKAKEIERQRKEKAKEEVKRAMEQNKEMEFFKKRKAEIEKAEDTKILDMAIKNMDEEDERRRAEAKKKQEKLLARQALIDAEAARQASNKKVEEDFLEKQLEEEYQKELKHIKEMTEKRDRLIAERKKDMLEAVKIQNQKKEAAKRDKKKKAFPDYSNDEADAESYKRELQKLANQKEIAEFQRKQAQEKKERESAEREREKLEWQAKIDKDAQDTYIAQDYAKRLLAKMAADDMLDED